MLERNLGCEVDFYASWQGVDPSILPNFGCVIASGILIEALEDPLMLWGVASAIRYFNVPAVFVDTSFEAGSLIPRVYPQIKLVSYQGDANQFLLQLRTCAPQLFFDNPRFSSSHSASANAWRYQEIARSSELNHALDGVRQSNVTDDNVHRSAMTGSFGPVSSIPLGMRQSVQTQSPASIAASGTFRKDGMGPGRVDEEEFDFKLQEISSSGISGISGISDILKAADSDPSGSLSQISGSRPRVSRSGEQHAQARRAINNTTSAAYEPDTITVSRAIADVQYGTVEFGSLIRIATTMMRLKLTGVMEIQSDTRGLRLEFRRGKPYTTASNQAILSALCWSTGEFNFNASRLLSVNSQPVDLLRLMQSAVREQFPLQPILRILEANHPHFIARSNFFTPVDHAVLTAHLGLYDGTHTVLDCLKAEPNATEDIAREIYLAYMCDDLCLFDQPVKAPIIIEYEVAEPAVSPESLASSQISDAALDNSQINAVRADLMRVRASFDTDDGYKILGLQPGCGVTALDDAYYAWINRYHSDRFVRYNEPSFVKLANELLMLMNSTYSKLAKAERANSGSRIGVGRARLSTINTQRLNNKSGTPKLDSQIPADKIIQRPHIRTSSAHSADSVAVDLAKSNAQRRNVRTGQQVMTMSEMLAKRAASTATPEPAAPQAAVDSRVNPQIIRSPSVRTRATNLTPQATSSSIPANNVTPQQHFATAKKKLTLGLAKDALTALNWALQGEPDNIEFQAHKAYAEFLVDGSVRDTSIETIKKIITEMRQQHFGENTPEIREMLFYPYYFVGKLQMAAENYPAAKEALAYAAKLNPSDVDTQRSVRYVDMQIEKQEKEVPKNRGIFAAFKDRFTGKK